MKLSDKVKEVLEQQRYFEVVWGDMTVSDREKLLISIGIDSNEAKKKRVYSWFLLDDKDRAKIIYRK